MDAIVLCTDKTQVMLDLSKYVFTDHHYTVRDKKHPLNNNNKKKP